MMNGVSSQTPQSPLHVSTSTRVLWIGVVVALLVVAGLVYWLYTKPVAPPAPLAEPPAGGALAQPDLGSDVYEKAANPVAGELPETVAPLPNPLEEIYKNPFE